MIIPESYELIRTETITEIGAVAYMLHHKKTGAKVLLMDTADDNKVFSIAFRTTPDNSEGTPHIMEHSVLCGSEKYPLKDPFIELAKGSLNTFLNAMTWPEKTAYPVASRNQADFRNLMDVYLDAVFHPNIYKTEKIFRQEGWHYEMTEPDGDLTINGVVYNEMRGAYSDPDRLLEEMITRDLYEGTTYAVDSGGAPKDIPNLTPEKFIAFHEKFYHPSNSYIYLYGDLDFTERLTYLDREYLSRYEYKEMDTAVQKSVKEKKMTTVRCPYAVAKDDRESKCIFALSKIVGGLMNPVEYLAYQVLSYALLNAPGAPLYSKIIERGIGTEVYGGYDSGYMESLFSIDVRGAEEKNLEFFLETVREVLDEQVRKGINKRALMAGINNIEFSMREADFGSTPRGLVYWMQIAETWIHDEDKALIHLKYNDTFKELRALAETDYFECLARKALLKNERGVTVVLTPEPGRAEKEDRELKEKLAAYKATLSPAEIDRIIRETGELKAYQEAPTAPEELEKIPLLSLDEIDKEPRAFKNEEREIEGITTVFHNVVTSGIGYLDLFFNLDGVDLADFPYVSLLRSVYTMMDTEKRSYNELTHEISFFTGGLGAAGEVYSIQGHPEEIRTNFTVSARFLRENTEPAIALIKEIFGHTKFDNTVRLKEIISEISENLKDTLESEGHRTAMRRVLSYEMPVSQVEEKFSGLSFYRFIRDLEANFETKKDAVVRKLYEVEKKILRRNGLIVSFTGEEADYGEMKRHIGNFLTELPVSTCTPGERNFDFTPKNEGIKTAAMVQYVAQGGNYTSMPGKEASFGAFQVLRTLLSYEYLWTNVRVKGGAYGAMMQVSEGKLAFSSYRDPKLRETYEVYRNMPEYLRTLTVSDRDLLKYIIGTIGTLDMPKLPAAEGRASMIAYLRKATYEKAKEVRAQVLNCTLEALRELAAPVEYVLNKHQITTVGNEAVINENKDLFAEVSPLYGEKSE